MSLPPKLYFRIGEVASLVGVEPHVLRYWEREFRTIRPTKSAKGQRVYSRKDVENLLRVRDLLYGEGFTIAGAKKKLKTGGNTEPTSAAAAGTRAATDRDEDDDRAPQPQARAEAAGDATPLETVRSFARPSRSASPEPAAAPARDVAPAAPPPPEPDRAARAALADLRAEIVAFLADLDGAADGSNRA